MTAEHDEHAEASTYPIRAVERVCAILDMLADADEGVSLGEVAAAAGLPRPSTYRYLWSLEQRNYVEKDPVDATYRLGVAFRVRDSSGLDRLVNVARPILAELRDRVGETTNLGTLDGIQIVHRAVVESTNPMRLAAREGDRGALHATALGKAIAAMLPTAKVESLLRASELEPYTSHTITSIDAYLTDVEQVKERGYAVDDAENQDDGRCLAAPLRGIGVLAAVSVSAPRHRLPRSQVPAVAAELISTADAISAQLRG